MRKKGPTVINKPEAQQFFETLTRRRRQASGEVMRDGHGQKITLGVIRCLLSVGRLLSRRAAIPRTKTNKKRANIVHVFVRYCVSGSIHLPETTWELVIVFTDSI